MNLQDSIIYLKYLNITHAIKNRCTCINKNPFICAQIAQPFRHCDRLVPKCQQTRNMCAAILFFCRSNPCNQTEANSLVLILHHGY